MYSEIVCALREAAITGRGQTRHKYKKRYIMGWNKHVKDAHGEAKSSFQSWVLFGKPSSGHIYENMCKSKKIFKSRLKWCQDHQNQIKMDFLAFQHSKKDFRSFWKHTNSLNIRTGLPVSVDSVSNSQDIADLFRDHFYVKAPMGIPELRMLNTDKSKDKVGTKFWAKDVEKAIKSISKGKSPGHDGLSIEHLQNGGPHLCRVLALFYSMCVSHSYLPPELLRTIVVPVIKNKTGDSSDKNNYRPISLATIIAKVLDCMLEKQLSKYLKLHDNQFGFRSGLSTESAILSLKHTVKYYTDRKTPVFACFLDLSKAFDLVSYDILWKKLGDRNVPRELISLLEYWYGNQVNNVKWAGTLSKPYGLECGVRQGGLSSPVLFNLYVDALIAALSSQHVGCHIDGVSVNNISYADDMVLLSASICGLRKLLQICESYAESHGLKYNVKKSQFMVFGAGSKRLETVPPVLLCGVPLVRVESFKYLGHLVNAGLRDDADIERERRALSVRANMIARRFARCSKAVKTTLFGAYCTSFYTCSLWVNYTQRSYGALRVQYNNAFRTLMGLPRHCSASGMFADARVDCFYASMRKRCASLVRRVRASANSVLAMIADRLDCPYMARCCGLHVAYTNSYRHY